MAPNSMLVLEERRSGYIAIVWNGVFASMQFNCSCLDALDYCHGMCCRRRAGYSVELTAEETNFYKREYKGDKVLLATKKDGMECYYLTEEGKCGIHETRPKMCRQWHCSPEGLKDDNEIERRDAGWMLTPVRKEEDDFIRRSNGS